MKTIDLVLDTGDAELRELRPILEAALTDHFIDGFLSRRWEGDVLRFSGSGAVGSLVHESGCLKLQAALRPPASWAYRTIRRKIEAALDSVVAKLDNRKS